MLCCFTCDFGCFVDLFLFDTFAVTYGDCCCEFGLVVILVVLCCYACCVVYLVLL